MTRITITLEFERNDVDSTDVYEYLKELIQDDSLDYKIETEQ